MKVLFWGFGVIIKFNSAARKNWGFGDEEKSYAKTTDGIWSSVFNSRLKDIRTKVSWKLSRTWTKPQSRTLSSSSQTYRSKNRAVMPPTQQSSWTWTPACLFSSKGPVQASLFQRQKEARGQGSSDHRPEPVVSVPDESQGPPWDISNVRRAVPQAPFCKEKPNSFAIDRELLAEVSSKGHHQLWVQAKTCCLS